VNDLREAIREYVEQHHEDFADDVEDWILPKVRDLNSPSRIGAEAVILDEDFEPDFVAHLCGCSNWDEEMEERSDADCIDSIHGHIEKVMSDTADLEAQMLHMRSNVSGGLKRHIDNLISDLPARKRRARERAEYQALKALEDDEFDEDGHDEPDWLGAR